MKVGLISDLHFGFGEEEIYEDVFKIASKIFEKMKDCDIIFLLGDVFDSRNPSLETIVKAIRVFNNIEKSGEIELKVNGKIEKFRKPAVFAIHGNHDRRTKLESSPLKILEEVGILRYDNFFEIIDEKNKVAFFAMSNFPEAYAKKILFEKFDPKPKENYLNFLMLHQNIYPYVYSNEESSLKVTDLPKNFDLIIDGHIHLKRFEKEFKLLILGSPIITRIEKNELEEERGFHILEIENGNFEIKFYPIEKERNYYLLEFNSKEDFSVLEQKIQEIIKKEKAKPVIKVKVYGEKPIATRFLRKIEEVYKEKSIIKIENLTVSEEVVKISEKIKEFREGKSVREIILEELLKRLEENNFSKIFNVLEIIELLEDGDTESIIDILLGQQKTLASFKWLKKFI